MEQHNSKAYIGHLLAFGTILISSFNTNFMKVLLGHWIEPEGLVVLRALVATVGFWLIGLFIRQDPAKKPTRRDKLMFMLGGVLGMGLNLLLYIKGLSMTGPIDALVIRTSQPIVVIALAALLFKKKFTRYKIWGVILGIAGTIYVSAAPHHGSAVSDSIGGDALVFLSSISMALFLILIQPFTDKFNTFIVMKWMSLAMLIVSLPFGWKEFIHARLLHEAAQPHIYLELSFTAIMAGMVSYFMTVSSLKYIPPYLESSYIYMLPILGATVSILMGLQKFSWHDPIALVLIIVGFILINKTEKITHPSTMFHS